jgi:hypothetical protein
MTAPKSVGQADRFTAHARGAWFEGRSGRERAAAYQKLASVEENAILDVSPRLVRRAARSTRGTSATQCRPSSAARRRQRAEAPKLEPEPGLAEAVAWNADAPIREHGSPVVTTPSASQWPARPTTRARASNRDREQVLFAGHGLHGPHRSWDTMR